MNMFRGAGIIRVMVDLNPFLLDTKIEALSFLQLHWFESVNVNRIHVVREGMDGLILIETRREEG
jgi:hypothetical protein